MRKLLCALAFSLVLTAGLFAQTTGINGTVTDPTGAVIPNAALSLVNTQTGAQREVVSDTQGRYSIPQVPPGSYKLTAKASGFADAVANNIGLQVNEPATVPVVFEKLGSTSTTVAVEASTTQINTVDASLGNVITGREIVELPSIARNVASFLAFQPGVTLFGTLGSGVGGNAQMDDRSGSVNGGRSDQSNIMLDGADVNQQNNRAAFTSVLRVTQDSVEEFRTTTTNGSVDSGRGSGADITLVTKSGTNDIHGSLYEFRRGTETAANSFFNNASGLAIAPLLINTFGGTAGGPIKKNKAFYFINYEGRRDASATSVNQIVPTELMKQGIILYKNTGGAIQQFTPDQIKSLADPLGIGIDPAALAVMKQYPVGNNTAIGDGRNTMGYLFNAPVHSDQNTYIAKFDYKVDNAGRHSLFLRGNLQNDSQNGTPQFPGDTPNSVTLANNRSEEHT